MELFHGPSAIGGFLPILAIACIGLLLSTITRNSAAAVVGTLMVSLLIQLIGVSLTDPVIGPGVLDFIRDQRAHVEDIARQVLAERELDPTPARGIAGVVWAAILGIMIQSLVDPEFNTDEAVDALAAMSLSAVFSPAQGA